MAAAIVPSAVLGGGETVGFHVSSLRHVVRAFRAAGIALHRSAEPDAPEYSVTFKGSFPDGAPLQVRVWLPAPAGTASYASTFLYVESGHEMPPTYGGGYEGNVEADWQTKRPCQPEAARVRAALARLAPRSTATPSSVRCLKLPQYP
ncbi:MAG TPA: hypothetical protein VFA37_10395 [Gaiellaceae bacterium]|nr:hypothetical protein [Gaiellaceae bacterium]